MGLYLYLKSQNLISQKLQGIVRKVSMWWSGFVGPHTCNAEFGVTEVLFGGLQLSQGGPAHFDRFDQTAERFGRPLAVYCLITSFLSDRSQQISYKGKLSISIRLHYGVPHGSVLGPILYLLYTAELFEITSQCGFGAHCYADDAQVFTSTPSYGVAPAVDRELQ